MNKNLRALWIKWLQEEKLLQTREKLFGPALAIDEEGYEYESDETGYCCLGVLCELDPDMEPSEINRVYISRHKEVVDEAQRLWDKQNDHTGLAYEIEFDPDDPSVVIGVYTDEGQLPSILKKYYGLDKRVVHEKKSVDLQKKLIHMNDDKKASFKDIAKYLERVKF